MNMPLKRLYQKITFLLVLFSLVHFTSCEESTLEPEITPQLEENTSQTEVTDTRTMIKLGKQLENPYSVENMQKALDNLSTKGHSLDNFKIAASHLYIKFIPRDDADLNALTSDSTLYLYDYPLDYEIDASVDGAYYHDPEVPTDQPTYQYAAVKVDYQIPDVPYEVLAELYIPEELENDKESVAGARLRSSGVSEELVDEALRITNNLEEKVYDSKSRAKRWRGKGSIRYYDDTKGDWFGVQGVEVKLTRWFVTRTGITNADGDFVIGGPRFKHSAQYSFDWEKHEFRITNGSGDRVGVGKSSKTKGRWDYDIADNSETIHRYYCDIFRAAYHYYYKDNILGIRRPPSNKLFKFKMRILANNRGDDQFGGTFNSSKRRDKINIYNPELSSREIYSVTIHELAHASHWGMDNDAFDRTSSIVKESWARGVEHFLTNLIYDYEGYYTKGQYTAVVRDMINSVKEEELLIPEQCFFDRETATIVCNETYLDKVSFYTLRELEDALYKQTSFKTWRENIYNKYPENTTREYLKELFEAWE